MNKLVYSKAPLYHCRVVKQWSYDVNHKTKMKSELPHYFVYTNDNKKHLFIEYLDALKFAEKNNTTKIVKSYTY